jgi:YD repeat-containing protein
MGCLLCADNVGGGRTNTWDSQNRLVQCVSGGNTSQFIYGSDGLRRTATVNGNPVHCVHDSSMMVREMVPSGQTLIPKATYLIGPRGPEYRYDHQSQTIRWYLYDGLGSVLAEIDPLGNLTASRKYDVYGLVRWSNGSSTSEHKRRPELVEGSVGSPSLASRGRALGHTSEDETGLI